MALMIMMTERGRGSVREVRRVDGMWTGAPEVMLPAYHRPQRHRQNI
jgi:hypothetical protein